MKSFILFMLICLISSCSYQNSKNNKLIEESASVLESDPNQAISHLHEVKEGYLNEDEFAYYTLLRVRAWNMIGKNISKSEDEVLHAKEYFVKKYDAEKVAFACFVLARVYESQGKPSLALHYYLSAEEWAGKIGNKISNFLYSAIPYNIAVLYCLENKYNESLLYIEKALNYINEERGKYSDKLFALELKAFNFKNIVKSDSALIYYEEALKIANHNNDFVSVSRILYNKSDFLYEGKNYLQIEDNYKKSLKIFIEENDSINIGMSHMALARLYLKSNKLDSALVNIYNAKRFLKYASNQIQTILYGRLSTIEEKSGNSTKAAEYKKEQEYFKVQEQNKRAEDKAILVERLKDEQGDMVQETLRLIGENRQAFRKQMLANYITVILAILCLIGFVSIIVWSKINKRSTAKDFKQQFNTMEENLKKEVEEKINTILSTQNSNLKIYSKAMESTGILLRDELIKSVFQRRDLMKLRDCILNNEQMTDNQKNDLLNDIDGMLLKTQWEEIKPQLDFTFAEVFEQIKKDFPQFNEMEYRLSCLISTQSFEENDMAEILKISPEQYTDIKQSLMKKMKDTGSRIGHLQSYLKENKIPKKFTIQTLPQYP